MVSSVFRAAVLAVLAGTTDVLAATGSSSCSSNGLAIFMEVLPAYAMPFCQSAAAVTVATPTSTVTVTPTT